MTPTEKRELKNKVDKAMSDFVMEHCETDEEFFLALLYFNQAISTDLSRFTDIFED